MLGRTARIGNHGLATTFYNESNADIAEDLVKILIENNQDVPDFLEQYRPAGGVVTFDDDGSDEEGGGIQAGEEDAPSDDNLQAPTADSGDSWGAPTEPKAEGDGWGAGW